MNLQQEMRAEFRRRRFDYPEDETVDKELAQKMDGAIIEMLCRLRRLDTVAVPIVTEEQLLNEAKQ